MYCIIIINNILLQKKISANYRPLKEEKPRKIPTLLKNTNNHPIDNIFFFSSPFYSSSPSFEMLVFMTIQHIYLQFFLSNDTSFQSIVLALLFLRYPLLYFPKGFSFAVHLPVPFSNKIVL